METTNLAAGPKVGTALAQAVAKRLEAGHALLFDHPEYCGVGLQYLEGQFVYAEVYDGKITTPSQYQNLKSRGEVLEFLAFASSAELITWLAEQTDASLSGRELSRAWLHDNQRLSLSRLHAFANLPA